MSQTIQLRQSNPDEEEKMAKLEEPDNDVYGYLSREVADQVGEFMEVDISEEAAVEATLDKETKNFGVYKTSGGAIVGFGVQKDILESVTDTEEPPESIGLAFSPSTEEDYEEAESVDEDEIEGLLSGDDSEEEEIEISDEELDLVEAE